MSEFNAWIRCSAVIAIVMLRAENNGHVVVMLLRKAKAVVMLLSSCRVVIMLLHKAKVVVMLLSCCRVRRHEFLVKVVTAAPRSVVCSYLPTDPSLTLSGP